MRLTKYGWFHFGMVFMFSIICFYLLIYYKASFYEYTSWYLIPYFVMVFELAFLGTFCEEKEGVVNRK